MRWPRIRASEGKDMKSRTLNFEYGLFLLAFLLGLGLRLVHLGITPLTDLEANWALQALDLARGAHPLIGAQPGYVLLTSLVFFVFGDGNYAARLLPALAGSGLVLAPLLFYRWIGRWPAIALAFLLAFGPSLVAASRQANGLIFAVTFSVLAAGFLFNRVYSWAGIFAGLALLGGPGIWEGALIVGLALLWTVLFSPQRPSQGVEEVNPGPAGVRLMVTQDDPSGLLPRDWVRMLPWLAGTLLLVGVLLPVAFLTPSGVSALGASLAAYVSGWGASSPTSILQMLLALVADAPLALLFGGVGIVAAFLSRDPADRFLARWALLGFLLVLVYPARQPLDLVWMLVPLWGLSARLFVRLVTGFRSDRLALFGQILLVVLLLVFAWLNFVHLANPAPGEIDANLQVLEISVYAALGLLVVVTLMVGWGWMWQVARSGLMFGLGLVLAVFTLSGAWHSTGLGRNPEGNALQNGAYIEQVGLLYQTVIEMDKWNTPAGTNLDLYVVGVDSPALRWQLRDYVGARFIDVLPAGLSPSMLITPIQEAPKLAASYTGQDFILEQVPAWNVLIKSDWKSWWVVRKAPFNNNLLILWVRSDLFPGAAQAKLLTP